MIYKYMYINIYIYKYILIFMVMTAPQHLESSAVAAHVAHTQLAGAPAREQQLQLLWVIPSGKPKENLRKT